MALRIGLQVGLDVGLKSGANGDVAAPTWSIDASANKAFPANNAEWLALIAAAGVGLVAPTSINLCQEAAGSLADVNGLFPLAPAGAGHVYQDPVTGYTRRAVRLTDGTVGSWASTDAGLPDMASASCTVMAVMAMPAALPGNTRNLLTLGTTTNTACARINITTGLQSATCVSTPATGATNVVGSVRLLWLRVNRPGSQVHLLSDLEILNPAFDVALTGKTVRIGSGFAAASAGCLYKARWDNLAIDNATIKAVSQTANWAIPW